MQVQPYLMFGGRCEEAIEFYRKALGAEVQMLVRFKESPEPYKCQPGTEDKVMHTSLRSAITPFLRPTEGATANPIIRALRCL
jgi:PhnB protein